MNEPLRESALLPAQVVGESPTAYADRLGQIYGRSIAPATRKRFGQYLTPPSIAAFMGGHVAARGKRLRLLDPAVGTGTLATAACEAVASSTSPPDVIELVAYEVDRGLAPSVQATLAYLEQWLARRGIRLLADVRWQDFLAANAGALGPGLLAGDEAFDTVICNPPYFKLPKCDPRVSALGEVVHGQPNVYGLFMAVGAALLREGGRFVYITPRSFASGPYFRKFREWFFERVRPVHLHVFESRTEAFDQVLQETVITVGERLDRAARRSFVRLSVSDGAQDVGTGPQRDLPVRDVLPRTCAGRVLYLPASREHDRVRRLAANWRGSLHGYGWEVSTGPVVAFRAAKFLRASPNGKTVPLLWLQHVAPMTVSWPRSTRKPEYVLRNAESAKLLVPNRNYVLLRRFSAKEERRRLVAAPHFASRHSFEFLGLENHLNYIHKPGGELTRDEALGLSALLNSEFMDTWFRVGSGNTQVSATELRAMPLPDLDSIRRIGKRTRGRGASIDDIVASELGNAR